MDGKKATRTRWLETDRSKLPERRRCCRVDKLKSLRRGAQPLEHDYLNDWFPKRVWLSLGHYGLARITSFPLSSQITTSALSTAKANGPYSSKDTWARAPITPSNACTAVMVIPRNTIAMRERTPIAIRIVSNKATLREAA
jgi:hypothetical protein